MLAAMLVIGAWITGADRGFRRHQHRLRGGALSRELRLAPEPGARRQRPALGAGDPRAGRGLRRQPASASASSPSRSGSRAGWSPMPRTPHSSASASIPSPSSQAAWSGKVTGSFADLDDPRTRARPPSVCRSSRSTRRCTRSGRARSSPSPNSTRWRATSSATSPTPAARAGCSSPGRLPRERADAPRHRARRRPDHRPPEGRARGADRREPRHRRPERRAAPPRHRRLGPGDGAGRAQPAPGQRRPARRTGAVRRARRDAARQPGARRPRPAGRGRSAARGAADRARRDPRASRAGCRCPSSTGWPRRGGPRGRSPRTCRPAGPPVALDYRGPEDPEVDESARICLYRFLQEACPTPRATRPAPRSRSRSRSAPAG